MSWLDKLYKILESDNNSLEELATIAGADPVTFYRDANFRKSDLRDESLLELDLSEANIDDAELDSEVELILKLQVAARNYFNSSDMENWAVTQNNLGAALQTLGERESGTARLELAVRAYENALKERTQKRAPLEWATTQSNLGVALKTLGERETGTERLELAMLAFEKSLQEWTQERVPLDWALTQGNLGSVNMAYFDQTRDVTRLDLAETHVRAALEVFEQAAPHYAGMAQKQLQQIAERRA